jgi:hypothetical protein
MSRFAACSTAFLILVYPFGAGADATTGNAVPGITQAW